MNSAVKLQPHFQHPGTTLDPRWPMTVRRDFANQVLDLSGPGLELGAYDRPIFDPADADLEFLDFYSTDELKGFAARDGVNPDSIVNVKYVAKGDDFEQGIEKRFSYIVASHVIEHIPDIISWLQSASKLLLPGGRVFLVVPDKRYTFDFLRPLSTIQDINLAYEQRRRRPTFAAVFDNIFMFRNVDAAAIWRGEVNPADQPGRFDPKTAWDIATDYYDRQDRSIHSHVFTSESFREIINAICSSGLVNLRSADFYDVWNPGNEFFLALEKI